MGTSAAEALLLLLGGLLLLGILLDLLGLVVVELLNYVACYMYIEKSI